MSGAWARVLWYQLIRGPSMVEGRAIFQSEEGKEEGADDGVRQQIMLKEPRRCLLKC